MDSFLFRKNYTLLYRKESEQVWKSKLRCTTEKANTSEHLMKYLERKRKRTKRLFFYFSLKDFINFAYSNSFSNSSSVKASIPNVPCHIATCFTLRSLTAKYMDSLSPSAIRIPANFLSQPIKY